MALPIDPVSEEEAQKSQYVVTELFRVDFNSGRTLFLTSNNENVTWGNDTYIAFPIDRQNVNQESGQTVNDIRVTLGDANNILSKEILNNIRNVTNSFVTIYQLRHKVNDRKKLGFRQVFRGKIKTMDGALGVVNFTIIGAFSDPQKPVNDKKFGEFPGMVDVFRRVF